MPVVFLHPTPLDHRYWQPLIEKLSVRAIVPDLRGHGGSELGDSLPVGRFERVPDAPVLTMRQLSEDVLELLERLDVPRAVFVGCSIGGYVTLELWRQAPERMLGLGFVCSKPQPDGEPAQLKRAANIAISRRSGVSTLFDGTAQQLVGESTKREKPSVVQKCRAQMMLNADAFVAVQAGLAARPDSISTVATIQKPVLAIAGAEDTAVSPADMEAFRAAPGGCTSHVISDAGHLAAYERPEKVAALIEPWLKQFRI